MELKGNLFYNKFYEQDMALGKKVPKYKGTITNQEDLKDYDVAVWQNAGKDGKPDYLSFSLKDARPKDTQQQKEPRTEQIFPKRKDEGMVIDVKDIPNPPINQKKESDDLPF
jgi:hypothetical protein